MAKREKVNVDDIIGIVKTEEPTNSVEEVRKLRGRETMTAKRFCKDCKHTKGIGYDFWCGDGHTEYEVFGAETNCPYYEYHDWSKDVPSMTDKRLLEDIRHELASISKWYAFEPTHYINTEKGYTIINNKEFLVQLDFEDLIKRIDKVLE